MGNSNTVKKCVNYLKRNHEKIIIIFVFLCVIAIGYHYVRSSVKKKKLASASVSERIDGILDFTQEICVEDVDWQSLYLQEDKKENDYQSLTVYKLFGMSKIGVANINLDYVDEGEKKVYFTATEPVVLSHEPNYDKEDFEILLDSRSAILGDKDKRYATVFNDVEKVLSQMGLFSDAKKSLESKLTAVVRNICEDSSWDVFIKYETLDMSISPTDKNF